MAGVAAGAAPLDRRARPMRSRSGRHAVVERLNRTRVPTGAPASQMWPVGFDDLSWDRESEPRAGLDPCRAAATAVATHPTATAATAATDHHPFQPATHEQRNPAGDGGDHVTDNSGGPSDGTGTSNRGRCRPGPRIAHPRRGYAAFVSV